MKKLIAAFLACAATIPLCCRFLPGVSAADWVTAVQVGAAMGLVYCLLRPVVRLLTGVFNMLTLGLVGILVDAWLISLCPQVFDSLIAPGAFVIENFYWALAVSAAMNVIRALVRKIFD